MSTVYWSAPILPAYDNEDPPVDPPVDPPAEETLSFTQTQLNSMMAEHKRNLQAELQQTKESLTQTETQLQELLSNKELTEDTTTQLRETLTNVQKQLRTKEQQAAIDKQELEQEWKTKYEEAEGRAKEATSTLDNHITERALIDAVGGEAYNLQVFLDVMKPKTLRVEGQVMVDLPDLDAEGKPTISQFTPTEAVVRMKELPDMYGGLFKSNLVNGIGGSNSTGGLTPGSKVPDISKVSFKEFKQIMKENPSAYGL